MQPDSLEARVATLEKHVRQLTERVHASEQDAAAARVLAGAADRDVTEFRGELRDFRQATAASFTALREDLTDLRRHVDNRFTQVENRFSEVENRFTEVENRFTEVDNGFTQVDNGFTQIRGTLDAAAAGQQHIVELLEQLIADQS